MHPNLTLAGETISDPKSWTDNFVRLVAARDTGHVMNALVEATEKKPEDLKLALAQLLEILPKLGEISASDLIGQREWGKSLVMYWYYLDFKHKVVIVSLRLGKRGDGWKLNQFNWNTDIEKADLP